MLLWSEAVVEEEGGGCIMWIRPIDSFINERRIGIFGLFVEILLDFVHMK